MGTNKESVNYHIPFTSITLELKHYLNTPISKEETIACLEHVLLDETITRSKKDVIVENAFRHRDPSSSVQFAIAPPAHYLPLTWGDVITVVNGLLEYFKEHDKWVETIYYIEEGEDRGPMGTGSLRKA